MLQYKNMGKAYIGTSGWQYAHWKGSFYPEDLSTSKWLSFYSNHFETVEVNSSFYRQTRASTFQKWQEETPKKFVFSVKGNRFITHIKRLKACEEPLKIFFENASVLLGSHVVLWQLPPSFKINLERLKSFLWLLPKNFRHAIEFRHKSWVNEKTWELLRKNNIAVVLQDWREWPILKVITADFIYIRFHGSQKLYTSGYSDEKLRKWTEMMKRWLKSKKDVYAYFNNDALGFATTNAITLKNLIDVK